jgi:hypothetical protein
MNRAVESDWPRKLLNAIRTAVKALPSEEEIRESVEAIDELIAFLTDLKARLIHQPTRREDVERSILILESFLSSHRGQVAFVAKPKPARSVPQTESIQDLLHELQELPADEIRRQLAESGRFSVETLHRLGRELGLKLDQRSTRAELADAVFKRGFANPRAYEALRGPSGAEGASPDPTRRRK